VSTKNMDRLLNKMQRYGRGEGGGKGSQLLFPFVKQVNVKNYKCAGDKDFAVVFRSDWDGLF